MLAQPPLLSRRGMRLQGSGAAPAACRRATSSTVGGWPWRVPTSCWRSLPCCQGAGVRLQGQRGRTG